MEFPNREMADARYLANLRALANRCRDTTNGKEVDASVMEALGLDSRVTTEASIEAPTPGREACLLQGQKDRQGGVW